MSNVEIAPERLRLAVLGPVRIWRDGQEVQIGPPQVLALLALLLVQAGRPVTVGEIVDVLWGQDPPATAVNAVHGHVGTLRRLLEPSISQRERGRWVVRSTGGYQLAGTEDSVDLLRFRRLIQDARAEVAAGRDEHALARFEDGLQLWQGRCAGNVNPTVRAHPAFRELDRECAAATREAADCALRMSRPTAVLGVLRQAADLEPLDEPLQARLMLLLAADGQQSQALAVFARVRGALADELGIDPCAELRNAHATVLRSPADNADAPVAGWLAQASAPSAVGPAQLPPALSSFTGRLGELKRAMSLLPEAGAPARTVLISAISGMAGIGKTAIAVHWAHQVAGDYPDGQLYINLRGFDPSGAAISAADALGQFLEAFGIEAARAPSDVGGRTALFRSLLAGRRVLVVLDNARDADQVRPLLPGSPGCLAIVTSRNQMAGLVAVDGAHPLLLDILPTSDAYELLRRRLDASRLAAEPEAVAEILRRCGGLPLALAIVAARAATSPALSLASIARELSDASGLDAFADADAVINARAVFSWSYRALSPEAARVFRLVGSVRIGADVTLHAAASIAGVAVSQVRASLAELKRANLIIENTPGRYAMHDLLSAYATELAAETDGQPRRWAAMTRLLDHLLFTFLAASAHPANQRLKEGIAPCDGVTLQMIASADDAHTWNLEQRATLVAAVEVAVTHRGYRHAWRLAAAISRFLYTQGHADDMRRVLESAHASLTAESDPFARAHTLGLLGLASISARKLDDARAHLLEAVDLFRELGDHAGQALTYRYLDYLCDHQGMNEEGLAYARKALEHYAAAGDQTGQAFMLNAMGDALAKLGRPSDAAAHCDQALAIFHIAGNRIGQAAAYDTLGSVFSQLGQFARAIDNFKAAVRIRSETGQRVYEADSLHRLGDCHAEAGEQAQATATWQRAQSIMMEIGHPHTDLLRAKITQTAAG